MEQQETATASSAVTPRSTGVRYGVIAGIVGIAFFLVLSVTGQVGETVWSWIGYIITAGLIFLAHKYYKDNGDGFMNYGQGISIALWLGLVSAAISSVFTYIYIKFIDTTFSDMMREKQIEQMQSQGMSDEQIDQAMQFASMFTTPEAMFGFSLFFGIIGTIIIALIVTIFTQKKQPETSF